MNGLEMTTEQLRQVVMAASRGVLVQPCAAADPPAVLILDCADYEHAKAIAAYVSTFDPQTVTDLLDRLEARRG